MQPVASTSTPDGHAIYLRECAMCHGARGIGTKNGPSLRTSGTASVDFMVRTGRMPLSHPGAELERHTPKVDDAERHALVDYTATFTRGPSVPRVPTTGTNLGRGSRLYREQCAACHQSAGAGGALAYGESAPALRHSSRVEVAEALRTGPGQMPAFSARDIPPAEVADIAAYVQYLRKPRDPGGFNLGHLGPVPEGLIAWTLGLGTLLLVCGRLGERSPSQVDSGEPANDGDHAE